MKVKADPLAYHPVGLCMPKLRLDYVGGCNDKNVGPCINIMSLMETESQILRLCASQKCLV